MRASSGSTVGGIAALVTGTGSDEQIAGAVTLGTLVPLTLIPGIIMIGVGGYRAKKGISANKSAGRYMSLPDVTHKRTGARVAMAFGGILTVLAAAGLAAGAPLAAPCNVYRCDRPSHDTGVLLSVLSAPVFLGGTVALGLGARAYAKYDYALDPHNYEAVTAAAPTLASLQFSPYASQDGGGMLLRGAF